MLRRVFAVGLLSSIFITIATTSSARAAGVSFDVEVPKGQLDAAQDGRVIVFLAGPNRTVDRSSRPAEWDYCHDPMPVYALDVKGVAGGSHVTIDANADHFRTSIDALPEGKWQAQAVFDWHHDASGWQMEPGNLDSPVVKFEVKAGESLSVPIVLSRVVKAPVMNGDGLGYVEVKSRLLSDFARRDIYLRAGIALPIDFKPNGKYAAIYEVPGFGGRYDDAKQIAEARSSLLLRAKPARRALAIKAFHIMLDPESSNGHTLFADSDVNGPYGRALVEELIPAIEKQYPSLVAEPWARLLTGHSSGGYAVCWLQTHYNSSFGGAWPSSPDPLDFHRFELIDIYHQDNFFSVDGKDLPADRDGTGKVTLTARDENAWEETVCPNNAGGQQWQSWQAVFGVPRGDGHPKALYDIRSGVIDKSQIDHYRKFDLDAQLQDDPATIAPIWREKIRLIVGDADDYYLHEAVKLVGETLAKLPATGTTETNRGYVKIVPGKTHDTIYETPEMAAFDREMLDAIDAHLPK